VAKIYGKAFMRQENRREINQKRWTIWAGFSRDGKQQTLLVLKS